MLWDQFGLLDTTQTSTRAVYREVGRPKGDDQSVQKHLEWLKKIRTSSVRLKTEVVNNFKPALAELFSQSPLQTLMHETDRTAVYTLLIRGILIIWTTTNFVKWWHDLLVQFSLFEKIRSNSAHHREDQWVDLRKSLRYLDVFENNSRWPLCGRDRLRGSPKSLLSHWRNIQTKSAGVLLLTFI